MENKKSFNNSLAIRLGIWFFLLASLPFVIISVFIRSNFYQSIIQNTSDQLQGSAQILAHQLALSEDPAQYQSIVSLVHNNDTDIFVLDQTGFFTAHSDASRLGQSANTYISPQTIKSLLQQDKNFINDKDAFFGFSPIPNTQAIVVLSIPKTKVQENISKNETSSILQLVSSLIMISIIGGLVIWLLVGAPLKKITKAVVEIGRGNLAVRVNETEMDDELNLMANAFNQMAFRMQEMVKGLETNVAELNKTQKALLESKDRIKNILDSINDAVLVMDPQTGKILDFNHTAIEMFGFPEKEFHDLDLDDISLGIPPYTRDEALRWMQKSIQGEPLLVEWISKTNWGHIFWTEVNIRTATIGGTQQTLVSIRDISERKKMEGDLRKSEEQYRFITENIKDVVWILDVPSNYFRYISPSVKQLRGYTVEEVLSKPIDSVLMPYALEDIKTKLVLRANEFLDGIQPPEKYYVEEIEQPCKDGTTVWTEVIMYFMRNPQNGHLEIYGVTRNINERKKTERKLQQYTHRLEIMHEIDRVISTATSIETIINLALSRVFQFAPSCWVGILLFDKNNHVGELKSKSPENGILQSDTIDLSIIDLIHAKGEMVYSPDLKEVKTLDNMDRFLFNKGISSSIRAYLQTENDTFGILEIGAFETNSINPDYFEMVHEIADILIVAIQQINYRQHELAYTEELEKHVKERTYQLVLANKELETFSYSVSHDLKAPIRSIKGYSQILNDEFNDKLGEKGLLYLNRILFNVDRMNNLIQGLLAYSQLERRRFVSRKINLNQLVNKVISESQDELYSHPVEIIVNISEKPVSADPEGLQQAIRNLLDNALKFTRDNPHPRIEFGGMEKEETYLMWIKDNGIGFDMQYHDKIFDIFNRLHHQEEFSGTGVGLALVRKAMERMGGQVWAEGEPGHGAAFYLEIPYFSISDPTSQEI